LPGARQKPVLLGLEDRRVGVVARFERAHGGESGWLVTFRTFLIPVDAKLVAAAVEVSTRSTISPTHGDDEDSSVSRSAMVDTEDGKNCGVSTPPTKPCPSRSRRAAGLSEMPMTVTPCSRAI
jgi:hypothetical protein